MVRPRAAAWALQVVTGRYQGTQVALPDGAELVIGRESDLDLVLAEDMVSRRHAKLVVHGDELVLQDLGSTNGTFVNGQKVTRARVFEGDRVLVGAALLRVVRLAADGRDAPPPPGPAPAPDEPGALEVRLPPPDATLAPAVPLVARLRDLSPEELDLVQLALGGVRVRELLDRAGEPEVQAARRIAALVEKGYLRVA